jgi:OOP family OmpA-OmpF porin
MSAGWVGERVSSDYTVIPDLGGGRRVGAPIGAMPAPVEQTMPEPQGRGSQAGTVLAVLVGSAAALAGIAGLWFFAFSSPAPEPKAPAQLAMVGDPTQRFLIADGVMYLEGTVPNEEDLRRLQDAAEQAIGADRVVNNLEVSDEAFFDESLPIALGVVDTVLFQTGDAEVQDEYEPLIELAVHVLRSQSGTSLTLIGHTDNRGEEELNLTLSVDRATAVAEEIYRRGVGDGRLTIEGRGESEPIAPNDSPEGRSANRRVEFLISGLLE